VSAANGRSIGVGVFFLGCTGLNDIENREWLATLFASGAVDYFFSGSGSNVFVTNRPFTTCPVTFAL